MNQPNRPAVADSSPARAAATSWLDKIPLSLRTVFYYFFFLAFILGAVPYAAHWAAARWLPATMHFDIFWIKPIGWIIFAFTYVLYTAASIVLMKRGHGAYVEFDPPKEFVATGPFRWCRNPIAACVLGMVLGEALAFSSTGIFLLFAVGLPLAHMQVVLMEEPLLEQRFGQTYLDYKRRVPRWIPRIPRGNPA